MYINCLKILIFECFTLAAFSMSFNLPVRAVIINKRRLTLSFFTAGILLTLLLLCSTCSFTTAEEMAFLILLVSISLFLIIIFLFETGWDINKEELIEIDFNKDDYSSDFDNASRLFTIHYASSHSTGERIHFYLICPPKSASFTAYCEKEEKEFSSEKDYKCIAYSYTPSLPILIEDIMLFIFSLLYPIISILRIPTDFLYASLLFIVLAVLRKFLSRARLNRFIYMFIFMLEILSVAGMVYMIFPLRFFSA